jgi:ubiquitin carboxyl-terminal hydrolase 8
MIKEDSKKIKYGICKYNNIGGYTCYINSILHILQQVHVFVDFILTHTYVDVLIDKSSGDENYIKNCVTYELFRLFFASTTHDNIAITPISFKNICGQKNDIWNETNHQDSQEFLSFLISTLEEEIGIKVEFVPKINDIEENSNYINLLANMAWQNFQKNEYSPLKDIFTGMFYIQTKCSCCSNISMNFEPFTTLQIAIPFKDQKKEILKKFELTDCLDYLINEDQLDKNNMCNCEMCGIKNKANKQTLLWKTPKVLIIHFKRFIVNNYGVTTKKLINEIKYPIYDLDMSKYIHSESPFIRKSKYNLIGVNLHQEFEVCGTNSGHYTSFVKNRLDNEWYHFNDGSEPIHITKKEYIQNSNAYLLFYYRQD